MKKTIMMAILAMLMFGGAVEARVYSVSVVKGPNSGNGKVLGPSAADKGFAISGEKAADIERTYQMLVNGFMLNAPNARQKLREFLDKRMRICNEWCRKKSIEYCGEKMPPVKSSIPLTGCQREVVDWVFIQEGCNYDDY